MPASTIDNVIKREPRETTYLSEIYPMEDVGDVFTWTLRSMSRLGDIRFHDVNEWAKLFGANGELLRLRIADELQASQSGHSATMPSQSYVEAGQIIRRWQHLQAEQQRGALDVAEENPVLHEKWKQRTAPDLLEPIMFMFQKHPMRPDDTPTFTHVLAPRRWLGLKLEQDEEEAFPAAFRGLARATLRLFEDGGVDIQFTLPAIASTRTFRSSRSFVVSVDRVCCSHGVGLFGIMPYLNEWKRIVQHFPDDARTIGQDGICCSLRRAAILSGASIRSRDMVLDDAIDGTSTSYVGLEFDISAVFLPGHTIVSAEVYQELVERNKYVVDLKTPSGEAFQENHFGMIHLHKILAEHEKSGTSHLLNLAAVGDATRGISEDFGFQLGIDQSPLDYNRFPSPDDVLFQLQSHETIRKWKITHATAVQQLTGIFTYDAQGNMKRLVYYKIPPKVEQEVELINSTVAALRAIGGKSDNSILEIRRFWRQVQSSMYLRGAEVIVDDGEALV